METVRYEESLKQLRSAIGIEAAMQLSALVIQTSAPERTAANTPTTKIVHVGLAGRKQRAWPESA